MMKKLFLALFCLSIFWLAACRSSGPENHFINRRVTPSEQIKSDLKKSDKSARRAYQRMIRKAQKN
jgi:hypothetical protein